MIDISLDFPRCVFHSVLIGIDMLIADYSHIYLGAG